MDSDTNRRSAAERALLAYTCLIVALLLSASTQDHWRPALARALAQEAGAGSALFEVALGPSQSAPSSTAGEDAKRSDEAQGSSLSLPNAEAADRDAPAADPAGSALTDLGVAAIDFSLSPSDGRGAQSNRRAAAEGDIEVRKEVLFGNSAIGSLPITVAGDALLYVDGSDVAALLERSPNAASQLSRKPPAGPLSFDRLRDFGINLRYDPISDRIILEPA
jgi:hypothetical protein